jgi:hypothetical protein
MEDVLDLYAEPYDPEYPVVGFDERPLQLIAETRTPLPAQPGRPQRTSTSTSAMARAMCSPLSSRAPAGGTSR